MPTSTKSIKVGIYGGTGFGAGELLRLLSNHPEVEVISVSSRSQAGKPISDTHGNLKGVFDFNFDQELDTKKLNDSGKAVVFCALPHGTSAECIQGLLETIDDNKVHIIDLSGDLRLTNESTHKEFYPETPFSEVLRNTFAYGLPEVNKKAIKETRNVANPGCFSTTCILAAAPLIGKITDAPIIFDAKTGTSGGGRALAEAFHHPTRHASVKAYKVLEHRHEPEIREALSLLSGITPETVFVPQLLPISRGIFVTAHMTLSQELSTEELKNHFENFYAKHPFVRIVEGSPELCNVVGSNYCDISVKSRGKQVVVMAALDNLIKGMAGQAIQNMNLLFDLPEDLGLLQPGLGPV